MMIPIEERIYTHSTFSFEEWVQEEIIACRNFFNSKQHLPYLLHYFTVNSDSKTEEHVMNLTQFLEKGKDFLSEFIPYVLNVQKAFAYFTCCEAWAKKFGKDEKFNEDQSLEVFEDKDEILLFIYQSSDVNKSESWIVDRSSGKGVCTEQTYKEISKSTSLADFFGKIKDQETQNSKFYIHNTPKKDEYLN